MEAANAPVSAEAQVALARLRVTSSARLADEAPVLQDDHADVENIAIPAQADQLAEFILTMVSTGRWVCSNVTSKLDDGGLIDDDKSVLPSGWSWRATHGSR